MGDVNWFMKNLDDAFKHMYKPEAEFLICGDITRDYLIERGGGIIINNIQSVARN
jgi:hypothetical protein